MLHFHARPLALPWTLHAGLQVLTLGGELLGHAEALLREGLLTAEIADGYSKAAVKVSDA